MHGQRNIKIYKIYVLSFFFYENRAVYQIMWEHIVELDKPQTKTRHMRIAWWITKATYVHTECAILIDFPCINGCTNTPQCYFVFTWPVLAIISLFFTYPKHKSLTITTNVTLIKFNFVVYRNVQTLTMCQDPVDVQGKDTTIQRLYSIVSLFMLLDINFTEFKCT